MQPDNAALKEQFHRIFGPGRERKWNEIQNTSKDIQLLSNHLLVLYRAAVRHLDSPNDGRPVGGYPAVRGRL